ncbi:MULTISPECIES: ABC transporter ATP-binding protein [Haloferax]|uniref:Branched-chain amino acid ABC transporter ATP-binding protein n=2 Tax=Haloferax gibbonsii TaxID=35746 RepID=M0GWG7_HALGM|nr:MULTISPECIES: ABC transporter ATP-binding protein [Haloferax]AKU09643.1 leucine/isoleucine/valine transporter ATP-binding subunit [Haloferax gibbonsii]ELZ75862.1 branched-chain amino acid ABC transporter ATP-binding protein [Haloferax gibbonsii ATCC 33959]QOS14017.1 ABC-type transport system ATP-binding protein (probable substrate branched-chain amino acids) [Haloferax gibbonsii]RDZ50734.1 ABC transporter ATP-binding protein [Haloferax sp. Atlit-4N]REA01599.1 ABC transporter ATP-binding pro
MLELSGVRAGYDDIEVLHGVDMHVDEGEIVALIGSNGAGKTTTMRTICGILSPSRGEITYRGEAIHSKASHEIVERGIVQVPENRDLFTNMTVIDNLLLGAQTEEAKADRRENLDEMLELFPRLAERKNQRAGTMSGGEQQMLTLARALMGEPDLLILDEPSIGLAPHLVQEVFDVIEDIHAQGMTVLMVEQNVQQTLKLADRGYVMENGRISMTADGDELLEDEGVVEAYLGV